MFQQKKVIVSCAVAGAKVRDMLEGLGLEIATPAEARGIPQLKGLENVAF